jgi:hypothetical protein
MRSGGTEECRLKILEFMNRGSQGLLRLRELLSVLFDFYRIPTREGQAKLLRACRLTPTVLEGALTFVMPPQEEDSTSSRPRPPSARGACALG